MRRGARAERARPCAGALSGPPAPRQRGCGHHADDRTLAVEQRDQGCPDRYAADEVLRPVDRIDHPAPIAGALRAELFAGDRVVGTVLAEHVANRRLDRSVGIGDRRQVGLGLDREIGRAEALRRDRVGGVGEPLGQVEIAGVVRRRVRRHGQHVTVGR